MTLSSLLNIVQHDVFVLRVDTSMPAQELARPRQIDRPAAVASCLPWSKRRGHSEEKKVSAVKHEQNRDSFQQTSKPK